MKKKEAAEKKQKHIQKTIYTKQGKGKRTKVQIRKTKQ
jgi:hypothetical protein